ncbi:MAG: DUF4919 domain-containing protein [Muribaculaceae bacterium]|nr:DUF4919 domain-containing protein [Muribaculaceae bacterium]
MMDYKASEAFVKENRPQFDALVRRFAAADTSLTAEELAKVYYASPFAGFEPLADLVKTANQLYRIRDYRVAYYMYRDALVADPLSLLVMKKAANCSFFAVIDSNATADLRARVKMLQEVILATGDGATPATAFHVVQTSDAYQVLWDAIGVKDVLSCDVVATENGVSVDELLVQVRDEKEPRKVYVACYGETDDDRADFFIRKKGF